MAEVGSPDLHPVEVIASRLEAVLRVGLRPAKLVDYLDLLDLIDDGHLQREGGGGDRYERALLLADVITSSVLSLGDGPLGFAARALFGLTDETRGRLVKDRRRMAAEELGVMTSTFRKYYEHDVVQDVSLSIWSRRQR